MAVDKLTVTTARQLFNRCAFALILGFVPAAASLEILQSLLIAPRPLHAQPFRLARAENDRLEVSARQPFSLAGYSFGDFDLYADVELPEGGELDLMVRLVEPWRRDDGVMPLFHGRFSLLRMSAVQAGPVYRSREQALFDDSMQGGQLLAPGVITSIHVQARGRYVRANIAGVQHPWQETVDDRGGLAMLVRGGKGVIHSFEVTIIDRLSHNLWMQAGWVGAFLALLMRTLGLPWRRLISITACLLPIAWLGGGYACSRLLPEIEIDDMFLLLGSLAGFPLAMFAAMRCHRAWLLLGLLVAVGIWSALLPMVGTQRLRSFEDARMSQYFGPDSGIAPRDAITKQLHARAKVHRPGSGDLTTFFLGGGKLFEPWPLSERRKVAYLPQQIEMVVSRELSRDVETVVLPTVQADPAQQLRLFERFYLRSYSPEVVVFAVEAGTEQLDREELTRTLDALAKLARSEGFAVVLFASERLDSADRASLGERAELHGWPLVSGLLGTEPSERVITELAAILTGMLRG